MIYYRRFYRHGRKSETDLIHLIQFDLRKPKRAENPTSNLDFILVPFIILSVVLSLCLPIFLSLSLFVYIFLFFFFFFVLFFWVPFDISIQEQTKKRKKKDRYRTFHLGDLVGQFIRKLPAWFNSILEQFEKSSFGSIKLFLCHFCWLCFVRVRVRIPSVFCLLSIFLVYFSCFFLSLFCVASDEESSSFLFQFSNWWLVDFVWTELGSFYPRPRNKLEQVGTSFVTSFYQFTPRPLKIFPSESLDRSLTVFTRFKQSQSLSFSRSLPNPSPLLVSPSLCLSFSLSCFPIVGSLRFPEVLWGFLRFPSELVQYSLNDGAAILWATSQTVVWRVDAVASAETASILFASLRFYGGTNPIRSKTCSVPIPTHSNGIIRWEECAQIRVVSMLT